MFQLTAEARARLQEILNKQIGRNLSLSELQQAYDALMDFAYALTGLEPTPPPVSADVTYSAQPIANYAVSAV